MRERREVAGGTDRSLRREFAAGDRKSRNCFRRSITSQRTPEIAARET